MGALVSGMATPVKHCDTCICETLAEQERERAEQARKARELEYVKTHSVLSDDDMAWVRRTLDRRKR